MNSDEIMNRWKERRGQVEICGDFAEKAMKRIREYGLQKRRPLFDSCRLIELISSNTAAKAALVALGAVTGIIRGAIAVFAFLAS